jgi:hypothetical protein
MEPSQCTEAAVTTMKGAAAINHLKNNRIEYLVLLVFSHMLGLTDLVLSKTSGVCS